MSSHVVPRPADLFVYSYLLLDLLGPLLCDHHTAPVYAAEVPQISEGKETHRYSSSLPSPVSDSTDHNMLMGGERGSRVIVGCWAARGEEVESAQRRTATQVLCDDLG